MYTDDESRTLGLTTFTRCSHIMLLDDECCKAFSNRMLPIHTFHPTLALSSGHVQRYGAVEIDLTICAFLLHRGVSAARQTRTPTESHRL